MKRKWLLVWLCGNSREVLELQVAAASFSFSISASIQFDQISSPNEIAHSQNTPHFQDVELCFLVEKFKLLNVEIWGEQIEQFGVDCGLCWKDRVDYELIWILIVLV